MGLGKRISLVCRNCSKEYEPRLLYVCTECLGPLEVRYSWDDVSRSSIEQRDRSMWRYIDFLPITRPEDIVYIGAGWTPLQRAERLAEVLGVKKLYIKNETLNPTFSFKDRPASLAISKAREFKIPKVGCASTGNLASATAAHAAKAGIPCYVFMPSSVEKPKIQQAVQYGANVVLIDGTYDDVNRLVTLACDMYDIGIVNVNLRPYYTEGSKTVMMEIIEQLGWRAPEHVIIPMASGALLCAMHKGLKEMNELCLVDGTSRFSGAQPAGCSPIVNAFKSGRDGIIPIEKPSTIVKSLAIGTPGDGIFALKVVKETKGLCESVTDMEALEATRLLAKTEGIFAEPGGAITIAALRKLLDQGMIDRSEEVVCCVTGAGFKALESIPYDESLINLVPARLDALKTLLEGVKIEQG